MIILPTNYFKDVLVFMAGQLMLNLYPSLTEIIRFVLFMAEIPLVWLFIVKLVSVFTSGFSIEDDQLCICYCRVFAYHTIIAKKDKISKIKIRQSIWQRYFKKCDVIFYLNSKTSKGHIIKALSLSDVEKILEFRYIKPEIVLDEQWH